jgi:large subunit ribosomal protein L21
MYAVIETGGKQYKVAPNQIVRIEKLDGESGSEVTFDKVLAYHDGKEIKVGQPLVDGAAVTATIVDTQKASKVMIFRYRRRKDYHRKRGHRQWQTIVKIKDLKA